MSQLRFLHTSDWHLGKRLFKEDRLPEQQIFLQWLTEEAVEQNIDVLIIAGDIFDSPNPPNSALKLYFEFLKEWKKKLPKSSILIVAGNHDSGRFLEAPKQWLEEESIHIVGQLEQKEVITIKENIHFHLLPYFRNSELYKEFKTFDDFDDQLWEENEDYSTELLHRYFLRDKKEGTNILVTHHAFGPFSASPSEQAVTFSGRSSIPVETYQQIFDYVALGHIHKKQKISSQPPAYYCGSPIPFRFSESNNKSVILGTIQGKKIELEQLTIPTSIELHSIELQGENFDNQLKDHYQELIKKERDIYLLVKVFMNRPESGLNDKIMEQFKGSSIKVLSTQLYFNSASSQQERQGEDIILSKDLNTIFKEFYTLKTGEHQVPEEILREFQELTSKMNVEKGD